MKRFLIHISSKWIQSKPSSARWWLPPRCRQQMRETPRKLACMAGQFAKLFSNGHWWADQGVALTWSWWSRSKPMDLRKLVNHKWIKDFKRFSNQNSEEDSWKLVLTLEGCWGSCSSRSIHELNLKGIRSADFQIDEPANPNELEQHWHTVLVWTHRRSLSFPYNYFYTLIFSIQSSFHIFIILSDVTNFWVSIHETVNQLNGHYFDVGRDLASVDLELKLRELMTDCWVSLGG